MPSYHNYQYLCHGSHRKSACYRYFDPFTIGSPVKNKHLALLRQEWLIMTKVGKSHLALLRQE
jgi:hypothetical protein